MTLLYFDCFSGASGDMILGALIDAGVKLEDVRRALGSLAIAADTVWTEPVTRAGIRATKFNVRGELGTADLHHQDHGHQHHDDPAELEPVHAHHHGGKAHQPVSPSHRQGTESRRPPLEESPRRESQSHLHTHRSLAEIFQLIDRSALSDTARDRAKQLFMTLGQVEAGIHGTTLERVHLHEVGALDSIIDVVGTVFALEQLGVARIQSSALNVGGGTIRSAHGQYPVPAPATMQLLRGAPIYAGKPQVELVTPTGALLIAAYATAFGPIPPMRVDRIGYGAGARDFADTPNVLRVLIGDSDVTAPSQSVVVIEAEIDDMSPQIFGLLMDRLLADGALDVFYTPIQMKKNRPGTLITVIADPGLRERVTAMLFRETTTIGVRYREMARDVLTRELVTVTTELGPVRMKVATRGGELLNAAPEFDDCVRLAAQHDVPVKHVHALAITAFLQTKRGL